MSSEEAPIETEIAIEVPSGYREESRLDIYVTRSVMNASRSKVQEAIRGGWVTVNGRVVNRVSQKVRAGDRIVCRVMKPPPIHIEPENIPLDIVWEDEHLLIVNKPAGMVVHPAYGHRTGTLVNALLHHVGAGTLHADEIDDAEADLDDDVGLSTMNALPKNPSDPSCRPGIVHRLDKDTSGLLVVAKSDVVHANLARQFEGRRVRRQYKSIVWGSTAESGSICEPVGRSPRDRKKMAVVGQGKGKTAITHYVTSEWLGHTSVLDVQLETGRTHQIRVHLQHIGHPVLGDESYGGTVVRSGPDTRPRRAFFRNLFEAMPRQALHARTLGFEHPVTRAAMNFERDPPDDMRFVLERLRAVEGQHGER